MNSASNQVKIREVGPRDGFQNEPEIIDIADKIKLINRLAQTGLRRIEVTSFVRKDVIPQLADAEAVLDQIAVADDVELSVLIPNLEGFRRALDFRKYFSGINVFLSASETHNRKNVNRTIEESFKEISQVLSEARSEGFRCEAVISVAFGCPYEGVVQPDTVFEIAKDLVKAGAEEIAFGDTTGMANPSGVKEFFIAAEQRLLDTELTAHFHNTRGQGLANVLSALSVGVRSFESSFGEIGGCPFPKGATGNIATEDLVSMLNEMGYETGIDLPELIAAAAMLQHTLGRPLTSHVLRAGPVDWKR